jgi:uncharacterized protein with PIN domain
MSATISATPKTKTIVDNGEEMEVSREELKKVRSLVYYCPECKHYHLWEGKSFEDIEEVLGIALSE